jgi:hypothetical protein
MRSSQTLELPRGKKIIRSIRTVRCMEDTEFFEGVRCLLVDRKDKPKWKYLSSDLVPAKELEHYFMPFQKGESNTELEI